MSASAPYGVPPTITGTGSPSRRLNSRAVRAGSPTARRSAASPMRISPSSRSTTTDGICGAVVPRVHTSTASPRATAAAEYVVPRSMPSA